MLKTMDIQYSNDGKTAEFNGNHYVRDDETGYYLCHDGYGSGHRLHRDVWEFHNGKIPKGYDIHHKDHNKSNNSIDNLQLLENRKHKKLHGTELTEGERERLRQNVINNAVPAAVKWHKSEEGKEWHNKHYKDTKDKLRQKATFICKYCGKEFETIKNGHNKFCSNNCKSAYRAKSGVDDVEKVCEFCGKPFITNKYSKGKYCSLSCGKKAYWKNKR